MADISDDELGSYDPTTPFKPQPVKKAPARSSRANSRPVAGPSSKPASGANGTKKAASMRDKMDSAEIIIASSDEDLPSPAAGPSKTVGKKAAAPTVNGKAKVQAPKSKAKVEKAGKGSTESPMELDDNPIIEVDRGAVPAGGPKGGRANAKGPKANGVPAPHAKDGELLQREVADLRSQLGQVAAERDALTQKMEELFYIRNTEVEQTLQEQTALYEAQLKTQDTLIHDLTVQLSKVKALSKNNKSYMLQFLTREDADEEKEVVQREVAHWQDVVKQKDAVIAEREKQISDLEARVKLVESDLQAEIQRGKTLAARTPAPAPIRAGAKSVEDPANGRVVRLYEDMTNFLITGAKIEKSQYFDLDEAIFTCIYTHKDSRRDSGGLSLNFMLKEAWVRPESSDPNIPLTSKDQLSSQIKYEPLHLDKEPPKFVEDLDFFKDAFMFSADQMTVFLKTLTDKLSAMHGTGNEEEEDDNIIVLD